MPKATAREITKSTADHAEQQGTARRERKTPRIGSYTSESPRQPQGTPGAFGKAQAEGTAVTYTTQGAHVKLVKDSRDKFWDSLGKQVAHGAAVRVNVKG